MSFLFSWYRGPASRRGFLRSVTCDTMKGVRQVDNPFVCFGAKPDSRSRTRPEVGKGTPGGVGQRNSEKAVGDG